MAEKENNTIEEAILEHVGLAPLTTLGIGGAARYFIEATSHDHLVEAVAWARARNLPLFLLGGGSNVVVADEGFAGLVIRLAIRGMEVSDDDGKHCRVKAGGGEEWGDFVAACVARGLAGVECLAGIPGRVGATPIQNVGAYGQEVSETIVAVEALDLQSGELVELSAAECEFAYRSSRFKTRDRNRFFVTSVTYNLTLDGPPSIRYPELQRFLEEQGGRNPGLQEVSRAVFEIRRRKAMVLSEDPDSRSVGSFFVNPTLSQDEFENLRTRAGTESMPAFPAADGRVKLSAAWLIERAGIHRGTVFGNVGTSSKHALAIINRGGGTAREVKALASLIQARVRAVFGVELTPEPVFVGCE